MDLLGRVKESLSRVVHPETGLDVIHMKLVRDLKVHNDGRVELRFRPYSMYCPSGFRQGIKIKKAVTSVPGVNGVNVKVDGHICAERLEKLLGVVN
ncbi:MAG: iron-sulfur cluster assembly protein [Syntrophobacterales bacterium]|jgi:metal-sulfur cluster biosynthetic enzyme